MKLPVWPNTQLSDIPSEISEIHLVRPIKGARLLELVSKKGITKIFLGKSTLARLSKKTQKALSEMGVGFSIDQKRGRPISIDLEKLKNVVELHKDFQSYRKIEKLTNIPKSTAHYLVKYASRQKIRGGKKLYYV